MLQHTIRHKGVREWKLGKVWIGLAICLYVCVCVAREYVCVPVMRYMCVRVCACEFHMCVVLCALRYIGVLDRCEHHNFDDHRMTGENSFKILHCCQEVRHVCPEHVAIFDKISYLVEWCVIYIIRRVIFLKFHFVILHQSVYSIWKKFFHSFQESLSDRNSSEPLSGVLKNPRKRTVHWRKFLASIHPKSAKFYKFYKFCNITDLFATRPGLFRICNYFFYICNYIIALKRYQDSKKNQWRFWELKWSVYRIL